VNEYEIICTVCARGCRVAVSEDGGELVIKGKLCRNGQEYVRQEYRDPRRVLTTTIRVQDQQGKLIPIPVRTKGPVPKGKIMECMRFIKGLKLSVPLKIGDVIVHNLLETGEDLITCSSFPASPSNS